MSKKIGIIGFGIIGKAVWKLFKNTDLDIRVFDPNLNYYSYADSVKNDKEVPVSTKDKNQAKKLLDECDISFVCVPTPHNQYDGLDMTIIEDVISSFSPKLFIICSALQPGTADKLSKQYSKQIVVQPEYFGETTNHPLVEMKNNQFLILGGTTENVDTVIDLYQHVYNANVKIRKVTCLEAEVIKLSENRAIGYKVAQCQELYDACKAAGVDYNVIREAVYGDDPRFNLWWTFIYKEKRGMSSKCLP